MTRKLSHNNTQEKEATNNLINIILDLWCRKKSKHTYTIIVKSTLSPSFVHEEGENMTTNPKFY